MTAEVAGYCKPAATLRLLTFLRAFGNDSTNKIVRITTILHLIHQRQAVAVIGAAMFSLRCIFLNSQIGVT